MEQLSDSVLATYLSQGSDEAFTEIYNRYWSVMVLAARNRTNDDYLAEEMVQNIFLNLWRNRQRITVKESFRPYFSVAVKYEVLNHFSRRKTRLSYLDWLGRQPVTTASLDDMLDYKLLQEQIEKTVCLLPEKCQLVFRLRVEKGFTQKEIAQELDMAEKTVEAHLTKARKLVRQVRATSRSLTLMLFLLDL
ncbi:RNA polymerase sigma factor [Sphingobacterium griseoflavum]|uniref:RNA polymerase sigma-70 factor n=1 Tax=Sphingobacterium griseoflavum TaxID=1474952 RepID=A0ABQ3HSW7_9SPHI|nr:sigma-70 family RNA polymerase sigma factor [Sphingobacterium griseoflavum]GHE31128.1 hypothetical protein GCM10017764_12740 [Sphingobacterium griseoflavum]